MAFICIIVGLLCKQYAFIVVSNMLFYYFTCSGVYIHCVCLLCVLFYTEFFRSLLLSLSLLLRLNFISESWMLSNAHIHAQASVTTLGVKLLCQIYNIYWSNVYIFNKRIVYKMPQCNGLGSFSEISNVAVCAYVWMRVRAYNASIV